MVANPIRIVLRSARTLLSLLATVVVLFPFYWILQLSLKTQRLALQYPPQILFTPRFDAYVDAWTRLGFVSAFFNSVIVSALALSVSLILGFIAAYAFSRFRFRGDQVILFVILMTRVFPPIAIILPYYIVLRRVGLHDTHIGLAMAYVAMVLPMAIWMLKGFLDTVPDAMEECARVDGASRFQAITRITLPLVAPGLVTTGIFAFVISWNEFLFALILTSRTAKTMPVVIAEFVGDTGVEWPQIMAAAIIVLLPVIAFSFIMQKHLAKGLTAGAVKG